MRCAPFTGERVHWVYVLKFLRIPPGYKPTRTFSSSSLTIGLQSTGSAVATAYPVGSISGFLEDTIRIGPRKDVFHVLFR